MSGDGEWWYGGGAVVSLIRARGEREIDRWIVEEERERESDERAVVGLWTYGPITAYLY